jgi:GDP-4-dehydro-6-deoxy-D-mannose reductase
VGSHLTDLILQEAPDAAVHGIVKESQITYQPNLAHLAGKLDLRLHTLDLTSEAARLTGLVEEVQPDYIFHFAAQSLPNQSFAQPGPTLMNNTISVLNLLEATRKAVSKSGGKYNPIILNAGSGDVYGYIEPEDLPVRENQPFRPGNPYAVSKISQEMLGYQYAKSYKLQIINTRAFNQVGPRQNPELATSAFARQIAQAEKGLVEPIVRVGNLEASRDYTDVRDMVRAYWLAVTGGKCQAGEPYNLCSGRDWQMKTILDMLLEMATQPLKVEFDPTRMRPSDIPIIRGDGTKFQKATGWQPTIPLEKSLRDLLDYWREVIK